MKNPYLINEFKSIIFLFENLNSKNIRNSGPKVTQIYNKIVVQRKKRGKVKLSPAPSIQPSTHSSPLKTFCLHRDSKPPSSFLALLPVWRNNWVRWGTLSEWMKKKLHVNLQQIMIVKKMAQCKNAGFDLQKWKNKCFLSKLTTTLIKLTNVYLPKLSTIID